MFWVIEYLNGKTITELECNYKDVDKNNIKNMYFVINDVKIGFNALNGYFFIGDTVYDFKVGNGPYFPIQYKTDQLSLGVLNQNNMKKKTIRNIGYLIKRNYFLNTFYQFMKMVLYF